MFTITEVDGRWVLERDGAPLGEPHATYHEALAVLAAELEQTSPEASPSGVLPESWSSPDGICFAEPTGDGRDFSSVAWSWRDPSVSTLPLMFQDKTDMGHFGAELAGYISSLSQQGGTVFAEGFFYDSENGRAARDLLLDGRRFGVSVDPGAVEASWECVAEDEDGWCTEERIDFTAYEVIGLTMTPFPAFARASIGLGTGAALAVAPADHAFTDDNGDGRCDACLAEDEDGNCTQVCDLTEDEHDQAPAEEQQAVAASAAPLAPPRSWFFVPEPDDLTSSGELIDQGDGTWGVPLTITDEGQVYGHVARWGQCHTGYVGRCVTPMSSPTDYRPFHLGVRRTADGEQVATGTLTVGADHAPLYLGVEGARDHYAHTGLAWADVRVTNGVHGPWVCGALRPSVSDEMLVVLRASTLSGDWRGGEMVGVLAVNTPGFPILREALVAAGTQVPEVRAAARVVGDEAVALVAAMPVRRCPDCAARARRARNGGTGAPAALDAVTARFLTTAVTAAVEGAVAPLTEMLARIEQRTRHLRSAEVASLRQRLRTHDHVSNGAT
jgi:hypothetical protein